MSQVKNCEVFKAPTLEEVAAKMVDENHGDSTSSGAVSAESDLDAGTRSNDDTDNLSLGTSDSNSPRGSSDSAGYANGVSSVGSMGDSIDDSIGSEKHLGLKPYTTSGIGTGSESPSDHRPLGTHSLHKNQHLVESTGTSSSSSTDWEYNAVPVTFEQEVSHSIKEETNGQATTNFQQFHKVIESAGKRKHIRRKPARPHQSRPFAPDEMSSSSSTTVSESTFLEPQPQSSQQPTTKSLASMYGSTHTKRSLEESTQMLDSSSIDLKPCADGDKALKRRRFHRTFEALKECGLLDLTLQTASLIEQNKNLQQQLDALKSETQILYDSLLAGKQIDLSAYKTGMLGQMFQGFQAGQGIPTGQGVQGIQTGPAVQAMQTGQVVQGGQGIQTGQGAQGGQGIQIGQAVQLQGIQSCQGVQVGQASQPVQIVPVDQGIENTQEVQVGQMPQIAQGVHSGQMSQSMQGVESGQTCQTGPGAKTGVQTSPGVQGTQANQTLPSQTLLNNFPFQQFMYSSFSFNQQFLARGQIMPSTSAQSISQTVPQTSTAFINDMDQTINKQQQSNQIEDQHLSQQQQQQQQNCQSQGTEDKEQNSDMDITSKSRK